MASDLMNTSASGKYYKVQPNGKAQSGLKEGDRVVTNGGTYQILKVNADGSYESALYDSGITTKNYDGDYGNGYNSNKGTLSGASSISDRTKEKYDNKRKSSYYDNDRISSAQDRYDRLDSDRPSAYDSAYRAKIDKLMSQIENRDPFSYDLNSDMLYQQYKEQYMNLGQAAMQDTMGQAAGLTGGYGNTYATSAGSQAYQAYLQELNNKVPELYSLSLSKYNMEGEDMLNQLNMYANADESDYQKYMDSYNQWLNERNNAYNMLENEIGRAQNDYYNDLSFLQSDMDRESSDYWNTIANEYNRADTKWEQDFAREQFEYSKEQDAIANALAASKARSGGSSSKSKGKDVNGDMMDEALEIFTESGDEGLQRLFAKWKTMGYSESSIDEVLYWLLSYTPKNEQSVKNVANERKTGTVTKGFTNVRNK